MDPHTLFTECLVSALGRRGYDVRGVWVPPRTSVKHLAAEVRALAPRVAVVSGNLGAQGAGEALVSMLTADRIPVGVIVADMDDAQRGGFVARGACAVVTMASGLASVRAMVRSLAAGLPVMTWEEKHRLVAAYHDQLSAREQDRARLARLSPNEAEILRLMMAGYSPAEVARARVVSVSTVRTQVKCILSKLEVTSQISAVATARRAGWVPAADVERNIC